MILTKRNENLTDTLKFLGAISVVWYHNPYYWSLGKYTDEIDILKIIVLGWSMPFFYTTTAKFALKIESFKNLFDKVCKLLILIIIYTLIYEFSRLTVKNSIYDVCFLNSANCNLEFFFYKFRSVNYTPGYYLSDMVSIILICSLILIHRSILFLVILLFASALYFEQYQLFNWFQNPLVLGCFLIALIKSMIPYNCTKINIGSRTSIIILSALIGTWGCINYLYAQNNFWENGFGIFVVFGFLLTVLLSLDDVFAVENSVVKLLSYLGQKYSFGIFIFHQLCYNFFASPIIKIMKKMNIENVVLLYLILGVLITILSIIVTKFIKELIPSILKT